MYIGWIYQAELSCQIGGALTGRVQKSDDIQPMHQKVLKALWVVLHIVFRMAFSHLPRGLELSV